MSSDFFRKATDPMFVPDSGPGAIQPPNRHLYSMMGEDRIRDMIRDLYQELAQSSIAGMFRGDMAQSAERSALFFIGLLGGPPLYAEAFGPPRMRARHLPFRITAEFQREWLRCFENVLANHERYGIPGSERAALWGFLQGFSAWMVNTEDT